MNKNKYQSKFKVGKNQSLDYLMRHNKYTAYSVAKNLPKGWNEEIMNCLIKYQDIKLLDIIIQRHQSDNTWNQLKHTILSKFLFNSHNIKEKQILLNQTLIHEILKKNIIPQNTEERLIIFDSLIQTLGSALSENFHDKNIHVNKIVLIFNLLHQYKAIATKNEIVVHIHLITISFISLYQWEVIFNIFEKNMLKSYLDSKEVEGTMMYQLLHWLCHNENKIIETTLPCMWMIHSFQNLFCDNKMNFVSQITEKIKYIEKVHEKLDDWEKRDELKNLLNSEIYQNIKSKFFHEHLEKELIINSIEKKLSKI